MKRILEFSISLSWTTLTVWSFFVFSLFFAPELFAFGGVGISNTESELFRAHVESESYLRTKKLCYGQYHPIVIASQKKIFHLAQLDIAKLHAMDPLFRESEKEWMAVFGRGLNAVFFESRGYPIVNALSQFSEEFVRTDGFYRALEECVPKNLDFQNEYERMTLAILGTDFAAAPLALFGIAKAFKWIGQGVARTGTWKQVSKFVGDRWSKLPNRYQKLIKWSAGSAVVGAFSYRAYSSFLRAEEYQSTIDKAKSDPDGFASLFEFPEQDPDWSMDIQVVELVTRMNDLQSQSEGLEGEALRRHGIQYHMWTLQAEGLIPYLPNLITIHNRLFAIAPKDTIEITKERRLAYEYVIKSVTQVKEDMEFERQNLLSKSEKTKTDRFRLMEIDAVLECLQLRTQWAKLNHAQKERALMLLDMIKLIKSYEQGDLDVSGQENLKRHLAWYQQQR